MTRHFFILVASATFFAFVGCSGSSVVATIGSEKLTLQEFEDSYAKNNGGWDAVSASSLEDRQRFLDLIVKFRLKVLEATAQGLLQDSAIQEELGTYSLSVAQSYVLEKELVEPHLKELYQRKTEELRATHILFRINPNSTPAETLAAYNKALKVVGLIARISFDTLASAYSEDPTATFNRGDLGFFSAGRMVPEFEEACYKLKPGEHTSFPVRTQFGYHIIKLTARQPNAGALRISHILKRFAQDLRDTAAVRDSIWTIYKRVKQGLEFGQAAGRHSDDPGSGSRGGDIGFYERTSLPPDMAAFLVGAPLDSVMQPFRANYGYHIFKVTERKAIAPFLELEKDLRQSYQQLRYSKDYEAFVHELKKKYHLDFDVATVSKLTHSFDSTLTPSTPTWSDTLSKDFIAKRLFSVGSTTFTVNDFVDRVNRGAEFKNLPLSPPNVENIVQRMSESQVLEEHSRGAVERHPAFAKLMDEYRDGILLYRIEQDEVWQKVVVNDSLLRLFHAAHKEKYRWPDRINFAEIFVTSDSLARRAYWKIQYGEDFLSVAEEYTQRTGYREKLGVWGYQWVALNDLCKKASWMAIDSVSAPFQYQNGWSIVKVLGRDSARLKTFEEAGPELISGFQEQASKAREQEWIDSLKKKYDVTVHKEVLAGAFKRKRLESQ